MLPTENIHCNGLLMDGKITHVSIHTTFFRGSCLVFYQTCF